MSKPLAEMSTLSAHYDGFTALDAIDLTLPEEKIIAFCGPNGSGKSRRMRRRRRRRANRKMRMMRR